MSRSIESLHDECMGIGTELGCMMIAIVPQRSFRSKVYISANCPHDYPDYTVYVQYTLFSTENWSAIMNDQMILPVAWKDKVEFIW